MKTPIAYYGGKQKMIRYILPLIPEHNIYCEPFFGGGAVFFAKKLSKIEIINDINHEVINFYKVLQSKYELLEKEILSTLHSRELHRQAIVIYENAELFDEVKRAWAFWTLTNQGFSHNICRSWGYCKTGSCTSNIKSKINTFNIELKERVRNIQIECRDAVKVILSRDTKSTFFYCDPPYFNSDCGHYNSYNQLDFENLLNCLTKIKGKFLLSCYNSDIINKYADKNNWIIKKVDKPIAVNHRVKKRKIELLVTNYKSEK